MLNILEETTLHYLLTQTMLPSHYKFINLSQTRQGEP